MILEQLIFKYSRKAKIKLYATFLNLKDLKILAMKKTRMGINSRLLILIKSLYRGTDCQIKCTQFGLVTSKISVEQGCVLAPILFNLFLNDLMPTLKERNITLVLPVKETYPLSNG
uniref:Uncharacterized protein n=1 Tax=Sphaerodactylus townsendi TaxID=933632 RepID=A0ACB8GC50_9SAUR